MSDPVAGLIAYLADDLDLPVGQVRAAFERAGARGKLTIRVIDEEPAGRVDCWQAVRTAGRGKCLCALSTIERVLIDGKSCGRGGCPYGGDF